MNRWIALCLLPCAACFTPGDPPAGDTDSGSTGSTTATAGPTTASDTAPSTTDTPTTTSPSGSETTASPETSDTDDDSTTTTGSADESSTGEPAECGNAVAEPGELCFGDVASFATVNPVFALAIGDMDGNGTLDLITAESNDSEAAFYFGTGMGGFGGYSGDAFSPTTRDVATGHFTLGDDDIDAVWALEDDTAMVGVLLSDGAGSFPIPFDTYNAGSEGHAVATGDIDGDGLDDIVSVGSNSSGLGSQVSTFFSTNNGTFSNPATAQQANGTYTDVITAEFTGNDVLDVAFVYRNNTASTVRACRGNGSGLFNNSTCESLEAGPNAPRLAAGDFDADGNVDIIATQTGGPNLGFFAGQGNGTFADVNLVNIGSPSFAIAAGDLDNDGDDDAVITLMSGAVVILRGGAMPDIAETLDFPGSADCGARDVQLGDFNEDGALDIAVPCSDNAEIVVFNSEV